MNEWFERARNETSRLAPSFERSWEAAEASAVREKTGPTRRRWWLSTRMGPWTVLAPATAAGALALIALLLPSAPGDATGFSSADRRRVAELSAWNAPTDVLLEGFGLGLSSGTVDLGGSLDRLAVQLDDAERTSTR